MSSLINRPMSQSDNIKFGFILENIVSDIIVNYSKLKNKKTKNKKGSREKDHYFIDPGKNKIFIAEIKSNLRLDTEKTIATIDKCKTHQKISQNVFLVSLRWLEKEDIPKFIDNKFKDFPITPLNDYFRKLGVNFQFEEIDYKTFLNDIAKKMM